MLDFVNWLSFSWNLGKFWLYYHDNYNEVCIMFGMPQSSACPRFLY